MKILKGFAVFLGALLLIAVGLGVTGYGSNLLFMAVLAYSSPSGEFDPKTAVAAPDYAERGNWAALPDMVDPADLVPAGVEAPPQGDRPVDTFFIHPTGFLSSGAWISPMDVSSGTEENTHWMMANQASAYNGCCNVYAPRYREANIHAYFGTEEKREALLGFAYQDVRRAFEHYLNEYNDGRPFILASHSQGSHHAMRLLEELIDPGPLHEQMVAAYMIGAVLIPVSPDWFGGMRHIQACQREDDLHCVIHWDTMPEGSEPIQRAAPSLCTNPLTWRVDEAFAGPELNAGSVVPGGTFVTAFGSVADTALGQVFDSLSAPLPNHTGARCLDGSLFAAKQTLEGFTRVGAEGMDDSYHVLDYALFYMNIRNNAQLRARTWLDGRASVGGSL